MKNSRSSRRSRSELESLAKLLDLRSIRAERCRRKLSEFVRDAWSTAEPAVPFRHNWHVDAVCDHLEAVTRGDIRRLLINIPPGHAKSLLVSVFWPAWVWLRRPQWRAIFASYADDLSVRDSIRCRAVIESDWYRETFAPEWSLVNDLNRADHFKNSESGERFSTSVAGKATGFRGDAVVCDDAANAVDVYSKAKREAAIRWWDKSMSSRLNDQRVGAKVVIAQRLHMEDLPGHLLELGDYEHLCLPSEFEPRRRCRTSLPFVDPRKEAGELLFPEMFPKEVIAQAKKDLGSDGFAGQHQQTPVAGEGAMFKRAWFNKRWRRPGEPEIEGLETRVIDPHSHRWRSVIIVLDCTFKKTSESDFVCAGVWGYDPPDRYLLGLLWERLSFIDTLRGFVDLCTAWPMATAKLVEDKANGPAVIEVLKRKVPGLIAIDPMGNSKEARAAATTPDVEAGNVWLPAFHPKIAAYIDEVCSFPKAPHDDTVDQQSYAILRLSPTSAGERWRRLVKASG